MFEKVTTTIDEELCTGCGLCVEICPSRNSFNAKRQGYGNGPPFTKLWPLHGHLPSGGGYGGSD